jgi:hypothetical protein
MAYPNITLAIINAVEQAFTILLSLRPKRSQRRGRVVRGANLGR